MQFRLLGALSVLDNDLDIPIRAPKQRIVLASLLLRSNQIVTIDELVERVWDEAPPSGARAALHNHVLRLRHTLGPAVAPRITTHPPGYQITVREGELDLDCFAALLDIGRGASRTADWAVVADALREALSLWRADSLHDVPSRILHTLDGPRLHEMHAAALHLRIDADLHSGRHYDVITELTALAAAFPLRESVHRQLMLALYRCGRPADALAHYLQARRTLTDELGIDPGPELQQLHQQILVNAPELAAPMPSPSLDSAGGQVPDRTASRMPDPASSSPETADLIGHLEDVAHGNEMPPVQPDWTTGSATDDHGRPAAGPTSSRSLFQLPADTRLFAGRRREIDRLLALADPEREPDNARTVLIATIDGMGGVGKSALAVHVAHRLRDHFPDGQLFIDLHGYTPSLEPVAPFDALDQLLRSLGIASQQIPPDPETRAAFYRDRLAGTRTLILLDNAASTAQVRPLLPGDSGCLVVVTSRRHLTGLDDAHNVPLDSLSGSEALTLMHETAGPGRIPEGHAASRELIELCGHLPLAIRIAGARLRHRPVLRIKDLVEELRDDRHRLELLEDEDRNLIAVFDSSYGALPESERQLLRLLGLIPGGDFDSYAAANLLDTDLHTASRLLESLFDHNLLAQRVPQRYRFHDLIHLYVGRFSNIPELVEEHDAAFGRLLNYYQHTAENADRFLHRAARTAHAIDHEPPVVPYHVRDRGTALTWMWSEQQNILAAIAACAHGRPDRAAALTAAMSGFTHLDDSWAKAPALHIAAIAAADEAGDRRREAAALCDLGRMRHASGEYRQAITMHQRALAIYRSAMAIYQDIGSKAGEAATLREQGRVLRYLGDRMTADALYRQAKVICQEIRRCRADVASFTRMGELVCETDCPREGQRFYPEVRFLCARTN
jgi:DNA-binding SARP family transcriptional activator